MNAPFVSVCVYCLLSAIIARAHKLLFIPSVLVFIDLKRLPEDGGSEAADWLLDLESDPRLMSVSAGAELRCQILCVFGNMLASF